VVPVDATLPNGQRQVGSEVGMAARTVPDWNLDLGSYPSKAQAYRALHIGLRTAGGGVMHLAAARSRLHPRWHAWIAEVSPARARSTCAAMNHYGRSCVAVRPYNGRELAER
jgi:hypothetical protein